ncbi:hypothetical protein FGG78_20450 [Thioclava sp. BHET1]|nr:hypothetical protein FGG78_20450 [Thioclava sp. BHET1]
MGLTGIEGFAVNPEAGSPPKSERSALRQAWRRQTAPVGYLGRLWHHFGDWLPHAAPRPAVPLKYSIGPDYLICLETGDKVVLLRPHLRRRLGMTEAEYRQKWQLPPDYPMAAPSYTAARAAARAAALAAEAAPPARRENDHP